MPDTTTTRFAPAPASRLIAAYIIDLLILGTLIGATWFVYFTPLTITLISAEAVVASAIMLGASGRTPGMAAMRVCLIRDSDDAQTPSLGAAAGYTALSAAPGDAYRTPRRPDHGPRRADLAHRPDRYSPGRSARACGACAHSL